MVLRWGGVVVGDFLYLGVKKVVQNVTDKDH